MAAVRRVLGAAHQELSGDPAAGLAIPAAAHLSAAAARAVGRRAGSGAARIALTARRMATDPAHAMAVGALAVSCARGAVWLGGGTRAAIAEAGRAVGVGGATSGLAGAGRGADQRVGACFGAGRAIVTAVARTGRQRRTRAGGIGAARSNASVSAGADAVAHPVEAARRAGGAGAVGSGLAGHDRKTLACCVGSLTVQRARTCRATRAGLVTTNPIGHDAGGALFGLAGCGSVTLLAGAGAAGRIAEVASATVGCRGAGLEAAGDRALEGSATLRRRGGAGSLAVASGGGGEGLSIGAATSLGAGVAGADLAAGALAVARPVVAALVGRSLVCTCVVRVLAGGDWGAGTIALAGQGARTRVAAAARFVAADAVHAGSLCTIAIRRAGRANRGRRLHRSVDGCPSAVAAISGHAATTTGSSAADSGISRARSTADEHGTGTATQSSSDSVAARSDKGAAPTAHSADDCITTVCTYENASRTACAAASRGGTCSAAAAR